MHSDPRGYSSPLNNEFSQNVGGLVWFYSFYVLFRGNEPQLAPLSGFRHAKLDLWGIRSRQLRIRRMMCPLRFSRSHCALLSDAVSKFRVMQLPHNGEKLIGPIEKFEVGGPTVNFVYLLKKGLTNSRLSNTRWEVLKNHRDPFLQGSLALHKPFPPRTITFPLSSCDSPFSFEGS